MQILTAKHREALRHQEFLLAQISTQIVNFSPRRGEQGVTPADFMPSEWQNVRLLERRRARREARRASAEVRHFFDMKIEEQEKRKANA